MSQSPAKALPATTRLAPSPTGALHLGNARTFLISWAMARQNGWRVVLRIEDLDTPRVKPGADVQAIDDLRWLGLDWDHPDSRILHQLEDLSPYSHALESLKSRGQAYPCVCTRREIELAASAPNAGDHEVRYPGTCRPGRAGKVQAIADATQPMTPALTQAPTTSQAAWRLRVPDGPVGFVDQFAGPQSIDVQSTVGDFVIHTKAGLPAYQLAVVVDDHRQGVTDIVRGDDLIPSAARQIWLYRLLGLDASIPRYCHLPLVIGPDGRRLAKRHGDTRLSWYREHSVTAERVIGLIASWSGVVEAPRPMTIQEFADRFRIDRLPHTPASFTQDAHAWLLNK